MQHIHHIAICVEHSNDQKICLQCTAKPECKHSLQVVKPQRAEPVNLTTLEMHWVNLCQCCTSSQLQQQPACVVALLC